MWFVVSDILDDAGDIMGLPSFSAGELITDFGKGFCSLIFKDSLTPALRSGGKKVNEASWAIAQYNAPRVESYMKDNAPWTDRTGNARNGLAARPYRDNNEVGIVLFHQVPYGIYLETRFDGRYAIIQPTIDTLGPQIMAQYNRILERM